MLLLRFQTFIITLLQTYFYKKKKKATLCYSGDRMHVKTSS